MGLVSATTWLLLLKAVRGSVQQRTLEMATYNLPLVLMFHR